jgi:hypothetical protein
MPFPNVPGTWLNTGNPSARAYRCGYCGQLVSSNVGWYANGNPQGHVRICPHCNRPTFYVDGDDTLIPGSLPGDEIQHLAPDVAAVYLEARQAMSVGAYTAAVLALRKLLMHIAVGCGANQGDTFVAYVTYLQTNHFVPPGANVWVDRIRQRGNEANHQIVLMRKAQAEELLTFIQMLLKLVYEYPAIGNAAQNP